MRITRIAIHNYRSCLESTFAPHQNLSVLIGPNGSGKTNILNALLLLKRLTGEEELHRYSDVPPTAESKLKVWFDLDGKNAILTTSVHTYTDDSNSDVVVSSRQQWYLKDFTGNRRRINLPLWASRHLGGETHMAREMMLYYRQRALGLHHYLKLDRPPIETIKPLNEVGRFLSEMRYYSASQFTNPSNCPVSFEIEKEGVTCPTDGGRGASLIDWAAIDTKGTIYGRQKYTTETLQ